MITNSTKILSTAFALLFASYGITANAQDSQVPGNLGSSGAQNANAEMTSAEEAALLQSLLSDEDEEELARMLKSEDYIFPSTITDNWHAGLHLGAMNSWGSYDEEVGWFKRTNFAAAITFGKYLTPVNDLRFQLFYGRGTGVRGLDDNFNANSYPYNYAHEQALADFHTYNWHTAGISIQWLPNFSNLFLGYNPERRFSISGLVGIGLEHTWSYSEDELSIVSVWAEKAKSAAPRNLVDLEFGLVADFKLTNKWFLNLEVTENFLDDSFDGLISDQKWDGHLNILLGINYFIPSRNYRERGTSFSDKYRPYLNQINRNREAIDNALANRKDIVNTVDVTKAVTYTLISFDSGTIEVPRLQQNNVYQTAQTYKNLESSKIFITNSSKLDDETFHQRAWAISKLLNQRWQIPLEDIWVDADESHIQKLQIPDVKSYVIFIINEE